MSKRKFAGRALSASAIALASFGITLPVTGCSTSTTSPEFFTVKGKNLEVTFCNRGASIYSIKYDDTFITYHPKDQDTFLKDDYWYGKALGRVAGRIKDGKMNFGGKDYQIEVNETSATKNNALHGGKTSFSNKNFKYNVEERSDRYVVSFNYISEAGESGFPESLDAWFVYTVYRDKNQIDINILGIPSGPTPVNLSTHPYFRLSNSGTVMDHKLTIPTKKLALYDLGAKDQTVIGEQDLSVGGDWAPFDFYSGKTIGQDILTAKEKDPISGGYDHIWKFDSNNANVTLENDKLKLEVTSDANAIILYANCYPKDEMEMNPSGVDTIYSGVTIEPIKFFTRNGLDDLCCTPDNPFTRSISYKISTK